MARLRGPRDAELLSRICRRGGDGGFEPDAGLPSATTGAGHAARHLVTSAGVVYRRPLGDLVLRLCGEFGGQDGLVGF
jgi:hypothetical protein